MLIAPRFFPIRTLLKLAEDVKTTHTIASKTFKENIYVDDVLTGDHNLHDTNQYRNELTSVLKSSWSTNYPKKNRLK